MSRYFQLTARVGRNALCLRHSGIMYCVLGYQFVKGSFRYGSSPFVFLVPIR